MAVTSKNLRTARARPQPRPAAKPQQAPSHALRPPAAPRALRRWLGQAVSETTLSVALLAVVLAIMIALLGGWVQTRLDDLRYGRPRMDKLSAFVGHEQSSGQPTQLLALNVNRRVVVVEFPGGDASQTRTIVGPYLVGEGEDLTPVTLDVRDLSGDGQPELLVNVKNEVLVYMNEAGGFRPLRPEEHQQLVEQEIH